MKKIMLMPFLSISSGHHQVAEALIEHIQGVMASVLCNKVDILRYSYGSMESAVSRIYIKWIHSFPNLYDWLYRMSVYQPIQQPQRYRLYEWLFQYFVEKLVREEEPQIIICTHALPSYILSRLKALGVISIPVINVYTDFFINNLWGCGDIDYHFVPDAYLKQSLLQKGVPSERIYVTGIPIHPKITENKEKPMSSSQMTVLISGGSLGAGVIRSLLRQIGKTGNIQYKVLCGKNKHLQEELMNLKHPRITPLPYITSREEMDELYNQIDAIVTKPGGVTVSECLYKRIPIFVYHALPGQERINLQHLKQQGLIVQADHWERDANMEEQLLSILGSQEKSDGLHRNVDHYYDAITNKNISLLLQNICQFH
ncbi:processive 1,2-diacylglycerol beta-glucosyltransferase [Paenibacillus sp. PvR052]